MSVHKLLPLFALILNVLLLSSALVGERRSRPHRMFAGLTAALAVWNLGVFGLRSSLDQDAALAWERFLHLGVIPIPVLFYHYVLAFLEERRDRILWVGYALCGAFLLACPTAMFMRGVSETYWGYMPVSGPLYTPFFVYFQAYVVLGLVRLLRAHGSLTSHVRKTRARLVIAGVAVSLTGGLVDFVRYVFGWDGLYPLGIPCNAFFALALGLTIVRYRLLDLGLVARWALLYLLTAVALGPFLIGAFYLVRLAAPSGVLLSPTSYLVITVLGVACAFPLLRKLEQTLQPLMFAREHGVRDALMALSKEMASILDLERLGSTLTEGLVDRIPVLHATLYLRPPGEIRLTLAAQSISRASDVSAPAPEVVDLLPLRLAPGHGPIAVDHLVDAGREIEKNRVALILPLFAERELTGVLVLGEKLSGDLLRPSEIELLEMLMGQTAVALENSRLYSDLRNHMTELRNAQQQLVQSAKLAAIGDLAASVAHEINNPLMIILGNCELAKRDLAPDARAGKRLATIESEARRAGKITRDLLNFARRREPKREPVAINVLIARAVELLGARLTRGRVTVETSFDPSVPAILGDADQLTQVLLNLGTNAVDAMPDGGTLRFETEPCSESDSVLVKVIDTGLGMTAEQAARIFEPFFTTKAEGQGTGLGMSVSLGIVKSHGGSLGVESEPGRGTTIIVQLPIQSVAEPAPAAVRA